MKKVLIWIVCVLVMVALVGTMTACSTIQGLLGNKQGGMGSNTVKNDDPDGGESGTEGDGGSTGTGDGGATDVHTVQMASIDEIKAKLGAQYYIKTRNINGTGVAEAATDGTYIYHTRPSLTFAKMAGDTAYVYSDLRDDGKYYAMERVGDLNSDILSSGTIVNIFLYEGEIIRYHSQEEVTHAGRAAIKYVYTDDAGVSQELVVDKYSGACLRHDGKGAQMDGFTGGLATSSFEVVTLEIGQGAQSTLRDIADKAAVNGWDTAWFAATGLDVALLSAPQGTLMSAQWEHNSKRTDDNAYWVAVYRVASATPEAQRLYLRNFMHSFFDAGAKYNNSRDITAFDIIYHEVGSGDDLVEISFNGCMFGEAGDYTAFIDAQYIDAVPSNYWKVTIGVETH